MLLDSDLNIVHSLESLPPAQYQWIIAEEAQIIAEEMNHCSCLGDFIPLSLFPVQRGDLWVSA